MLTKRRFLLILTVGMILAGSVAYGLPSFASDPASASDGGPEMRLAIKSGGECDDGTCSVPSGGSFTLAVEFVRIPDEGYILAQTSIFIGADLVYQPGEVWTDEYRSPDCVPPVRLAVGSPESTLEHGCLTGYLPPLPTSMYTGNFLELKMNCPDADSTTGVRLLPEGDPIAGTSGAAFKLPDNSIVVPKVSSLTIHCGSGQGPTSTPGPPTETPSPTPTSTSTPTSTPMSVGDANCDGAVDATDASLVLQFEAGLLDTLPCSEKADVNGDDLLNSLDAVLILQFASDLIQQLPASNAR